MKPQYERVISNLISQEYHRETWTHQLYSRQAVVICEGLKIEISNKWKPRHLKITIEI